jgi:hypothetical protein
MNDNPYEPPQLSSERKDVPAYDPLAVQRKSERIFWIVGLILVALAAVLLLVG